MQGHPVAHAGAGAAQVHRPVQADDVAAAVGDLVEPDAAALGEDDVRDAESVVLALELRQHALRVGQAELLEGAIGQHAAPGVENHRRLRPGFDLGVEVERHGVGVDFEDAVHQVGALVHQRLDGAVVVRAAAFDHVAGQRPGAAREADQGHFAHAVLIGQCLADGAHRVEHIAQLVHVGHGQLGHGGLVAHDLGEFRAFARGEAQAQAHGVGHGEDVAEQDGGVEVVAAQRLQRHLAGRLGVGGQAHEAAGHVARGAVFGQIAARLAHQPHGRGVGGQAQAGAQEAVVGQRGQGGRVGGGGGGGGGGGTHGGHCRQSPLCGLAPAHSGGRSAATMRRWPR